jgi:hypothetical protein
VRAIILTLLLSTFAHASGVYTWTDDKGVVHYSDRPIGPEDAKEVQGVTLEAKAIRSSKLKAQGLQGTWCEYEMVSTAGGGSTLAERVEWTFNGVRLEYLDLDSQRKINSRFTLEDRTIRTDKSSMGNHPDRSYDGDQMELGNDAIYRRLRRGNC